MQFGLFRRVAFFAVVAAASAAFSAPQASAQWVAPLVAKCRAAFDGSNADARCPALWAHAVAENSYGPSHTCWVSGSCALTVPVGGSDRSFRLHIPGSMYFSPSELSNLDLCFARAADAGEGQGGWTMSVKPGCRGGEIDSATAAAEGLEAPE